MYIDGIDTILTNIRSIQLSLLEKGKEKKNNKFEYFKKKTAKFKFPHDFPKTNEYLKTLVEDIFKELMIDAPDEVDSLGIWIEYDTITFDNAISLSALESIKEYSKEEINPVWEFVKMSLPPTDYFQNHFNLNG
jgi:hypothetical protein